MYQNKYININMSFELYLYHYRRLLNTFLTIRVKNSITLWYKSFFKKNSDIFKLPTCLLYSLFPQVGIEHDQ